MIHLGVDQHRRVWPATLKHGKYCTGGQDASFAQALFTVGSEMRRQHDVVQLLEGIVLQGFVMKHIKAYSKEGLCDPGPGECSNSVNVRF